MLIPFLVPLMIISCETRTILCTRERAAEEMRVVIQHARPIPLLHLHDTLDTHASVIDAVEKSQTNRARS